MSPSVPLEIQEEIMKRLPVGSLIRFRSVRKAWKSLIDSYPFIAASTLRQTQPHHFLIRYHQVGHRDETELKYDSFIDDDTFPQQKFTLDVPLLLEMLDDDGPSRLIGSSHGLLCFLGHYFKGQKQDTIVLWNPSIRKSIAVAVPNVSDAPFAVPNEPEPLFSSVVGFGVCPDTCDPKIVNITYISAWWLLRSISCIPRQVMVFSLSSKEWCTIPDDNLPRKTIAFTCSHAVRGHFMYWFAYDMIAQWSNLFKNSNMIMSFHMGTQEFREINLPRGLADESFASFSISRLRDSLALLQYDNDQYITGKQVCVIWMMEHGDPKSFTKLYTIKPPHASSIRTILGFRKSGEPIIDMILQRYCQTLVLYEPFSEHIKDLRIFVNRRCSSYVTSYTESLLLLNEEDDAIY